jgi:hypothetical protein
MTDSENSLGTMDVKAITPRVFARGPEKVMRVIIPVKDKPPPKRVLLKS